MLVFPSGVFWVFRGGSSSSEVALVSIVGGCGRFGSNWWVVVVVAGGKFTTGGLGKSEVSGFGRIGHLFHCRGRVLSCWDSHIV